MHKFYLPPDSPGSNGKVVLVVKGEEKVFDTNDPEQYKELVDHAQKGYVAEATWKEAKDMKDEAEKKEQQLVGLQEVVNNWNGLMEMAKTDDQAFAQLVQKIEDYVGRKMSAAQIADLKGDAFDPDDPLGKMQRYLDDRLGKMENMLKSRDVDNIKAQISSAGKKLAAKYSENGYPDYNHEEVLGYADKHGMLLSGEIETGLENAYRLLNYEALRQKDINDVLKKKPEKKELPPSTIPGGLKSEPKNFKSRDEVTAYLIENVDEDKLFTLE